MISFENGAVVANVISQGEHIRVDSNHYVTSVFIKRETLDSETQILCSWSISSAIFCAHGASLVLYANRMTIGTGRKRIFACCT